jgi:hypothetical protein
MCFSLLAVPNKVAWSGWPSPTLHLARGYMHIRDVVLNLPSTVETIIQAYVCYISCNLEKMGPKAGSGHNRQDFVSSQLMYIDADATVSC